MRGGVTNTGPMGPYRGAGRPEAAYFIERVMNDAAGYLSVDQAEIRRKTSIPRTAFPHTVVNDSGDCEGARSAPPAVANAVMDALRPFGVEPLDLPLTDEQLWRIIHLGGKGVR